MSAVVTQADRERAAPVLRAYGAENYAALCEKGSDLVDRLLLVQAFARHRTEATAELVEALESIVERQTGPLAPNSSRAVDGETIRIARAAIARARGEAA